MKLEHFEWAASQSTASACRPHAPAVDRGRATVVLVRHPKNAVSKTSIASERFGLQTDHYGKLTPKHSYVSLYDPTIVRQVTHTNRSMEVDVPTGVEASKITFESARYGTDTPKLI